MFGLGVREYVALGVLVVALLLGWVFFDPTSTEGDTGGPVATISLGQPVTPTAIPTATQAPPHTVAKPTGPWLVIYYERGVSGTDIRSGEGFVDALDFNIPDRPFPDFKPDAWSMTASNTFETAPGKNRFTLRVDGEATVRVDDQVVAQVSNGDGAADVQVEFDAKGGAATVFIEVRDTGGPVELRWRE